ncbi:helix-turn-helix transcriptional regulator [Sphingomonas sp.]|uniref:helix-turn-helix domain-containing protein n=1 Tax=Sphingomonas sp. TaxID=28214 RepID=UPI001B1C5842|nr:helix-turn-helix transcriptional regulator [Sphingomonas sp.]MBO9711414.1 helix-turn-helix transcriptional regulator [Sphingomonas sp.]
MSEMKERIETLSPRQLEILRYVAARLSSKEIAQRLGVSPATVDSHVAAAVQRMGVTSRREAANALLRWEGDALPSTTFEGHHGGDPGENSLPNPEPLPDVDGWSIRRGEGSEGGVPPPSAPPSSGRGGMGAVVLRYLLDGFYISLFFAVMSAVALGAHLVLVQCEHSRIDPVVLFILRGVSYVLAGLDGVGVISATGLLIYRFVRAVMRSDDDDEKD